MLDINELIAQFNAGDFYDRCDEIVSRAFGSNDQEIAFICREDLFDFEAQRDEIPKTYHLHFAFELGQIVPGTLFRFTLYGFSKCEQEKYLMGTIEFDSIVRRSSARLEHTINIDSFVPCFSKYLQSCSKFVDEGQIPSSQNKVEFIEIGPDEFDRTHLRPRYYTSENRWVRAEILKEKCVKLSDVAKIINWWSFGEQVDGDALLLGRGDVKFPIDFSSLRKIQKGSKEQRYSVKLEKGDIIIATSFKRNCNYVTQFDGYREPVCAGVGLGLTVLRPTSISSEYLYLYLASDLANELLSSLVLRSCTVRRWSESDLSEMPIVEPRKDSSYYKTIFNKLAHLDIRDYSNTDPRSAPQNPLQAALDVEIANRIHAYNEEQLRTFLTADVNELNICYSNGAYKAAIILAGSILEAVLIDWLSEIHNADYFEKEYMICDEKTGKRRRANLVDYIDEIKELESPFWLREASMAHEIRKKRNLVHAKLCIETSEINKKTARMVIRYLDKVLETRGAHCLNQKI